MTALESKFDMEQALATIQGSYAGTTTLGIGSAQSAPRKSATSTEEAVMAQHNVAKAKFIHQERQGRRNASLSAMKRGTFATWLRGFTNHAHKRPNAKTRGR